MRARKYTHTLKIKLFAVISYRHRLEIGISGWSWQKTLSVSCTAHSQRSNTLSVLQALGMCYATEQKCCRDDFRQEEKNTSLPFWSLCGQQVLCIQIIPVQKMDSKIRVFYKDSVGINRISGINRINGINIWI